MGKPSFKDTGFAGLMLAIYAGFFIWMDREVKKYNEEIEAERNELRTAVSHISACRGLHDRGLERWRKNDDDRRFLQSSFDRLVASYAILNKPRSLGSLPLKLTMDIEDAKLEAAGLILAFDRALSTTH
jgi:hypothetical protein